MAPNEWKSSFEDNEDDKYKLNEEIEYGITLRKNRMQEKQILLATENFSILTEEKENVPPFTRTGKKCKKGRKKRKSDKKRKQLTPLDLKACSCEIPIFPKMSEKFGPIDRKSCSKKEYFDLLSKPRVLYFPQPTKKKDPVLYPASPRFAQLAIPHKVRVFSTWKDYYKLLKPEQILSLQSYLTKEEALAPQDARDYFKRLDKKKKLQKKLKLKKLKEEQIVKKPQKSKVLKEINILAKLIVKHFCDKQQQSVKCTHIMLTDLIKYHLEKEGSIPYGNKRSDDKNAYSKTLHDAIDQLSVWLECNVGYDNIVDSDEEVEESISSTYSTVSYSGISEEGEAEIEIGVKSEIKSEIEGPEIYEPESVDIFEEYVKYGVVKQEESLVSSKPSKAEAGLTEEEGQEIQQQEQEIEDEIVLVDETYEESVIVEPEQDMDQDFKVAVVTELDKAEPEEEIIREEKGKIYEEHSPDAVCCVTIKTWTKWLVDVSHNTHHWCQWIQDIIARVRFFAAVIKGQVTLPDGRKRILRREEWQNFTETLDRDIDAWHQYNQHVKEISEKIINEFQNKRIICCAACMKSKLIIDEESAHQVTEQLVQALNTTSYWRGWLDTIVAEAQKLKDLTFELPEGSLTDEDSGGSSSLGYFEIIELKSPDAGTTTTTSSDGSVFVLLEMDKDDENPNPGPPPPPQ